MKPLFWSVAALVIVTCSAAWAQTIMLVCSTSDGYPIMVDVDYSNARVCSRIVVGETCVSWPAEISQRFIRWHANCTNCAPNTIDRATGMASWASGSSGSCKKSEGGGF